ncbi:MAG: hypothetical protein VYA67_21735 [Actinomycetota bacterium]|nr:hypothetical protein [Actinomycetota bacterium]
MTLVKDKPADTPTSNDLDNVEVPDLSSTPAQIKLAGKTLLVMDKPPVKGEFIKVELTLKCKGDGSDLLDGDELVYYRRCVLIGAKVTTEPYKPAPPPAMLNADGTVNPDAVADPDDAEDLDTEDDEDTDGDDDAADDDGE